MLNILEKNGEYIIFKADTKFDDIEEILGYTEDVEGSCSVQRLFRWSTDGHIFSDWIELTEENLIEKLTIPDFWLEFKYELLEDCLFKVNSLIVNCLRDEKKLNKPFPILYSIEKGSRFYPIILRDFHINPYQQTEAIRLQKELSLIANQMYGLDVSYFKADPNLESRDPFLLEWGYLEFRDPICFKVIVPNNEFPDNKFSYNMFGVEFDIPFEVHIDKRYFEFYFGYGDMPQKYDLIYFNLNRRLYEVISSDLEYNFMQEPLYYKVSLKMAEKQSHLTMDTDIENELNVMSNSLEKYFGDEMNRETTKITNLNQLKEKSKYHDLNRMYPHDYNNFIRKFELRNYNNLISKNYYDLDLLSKVNVTQAVLYSAKNEFDDYVYTCWFKEIQQKFVKNRIKTIAVNIGDEEIEIEMFGRTDIFKVDSYFGIKRYAENDLLFFGLVKEIDLSGKKVILHYSEDIYQYFSNLNDGWENEDNLVGSMISKKNFLKSNKDDTILDISILDMGILVMKINTNFYIYDLVMSTVNWRGLVVKLLPSFRQISVFLYERQMNTSKLLIVKEFKVNEIDIDNFKTDSQFFIESGPMNLTNIRLFVENINEEDHSKILNQQFVSNAEQAIIVDNAEFQVSLPFSGEKK